MPLSSRLAGILGLQKPFFSVALMLFSGCLRIVFGPPSTMDSMVAIIDQLPTR